MAWQWPIGTAAPAATQLRCSATLDRLEGVLDDRQLLAIFAWVLKGHARRRRQQVRRGIDAHAHTCAARSRTQLACHAAQNAYVRARMEAPPAAEKGRELARWRWQYMRTRFGARPFIRLHTRSHSRCAHPKKTPVTCVRRELAAERAPYTWASIRRRRDLRWLYVAAYKELHSPPAHDAGKDARMLLCQHVAVLEHMIDAEALCLFRLLALAELHGKEAAAHARRYIAG